MHSINPINQSNQSIQSIIQINHSKVSTKKINEIILSIKQSIRQSIIHFIWRSHNQALNELSKFNSQIMKIY